MSGLTTINAFNAAGDVVSAGLADGSVSTNALGTGVVTFEKIQDIPTNRVLGRTATGTGDVSAIQVDADMIASNAVTTAKINNDAVTSAKIADDAVVQAAIADNAVNEARLQISNAGTNGQFLSKQSGNTGGLTWATVSTGSSAAHSGAVGTVLTMVGYNPGNVSLGSANPSESGTSSRFDASSPLVRNNSGTFGGVNSGHAALTGTWRPTNDHARYGGNTFTYDTWVRVS